MFVVIVPKGMEKNYTSPNVTLVKLATEKDKDTSTFTVYCQWADYM